MQFLTFLFLLCFLCAFRVLCVKRFSSAFASGRKFKGFNTEDAEGTEKGMGSPAVCDGSQPQAGITAYESEITVPDSSQLH